MPHDDRATGRPSDDVYTVSYVTGGSFSESGLEPYCCDTTQIDLSDVMVSPVPSPTSTRESPDDLFASEYQMILGELPPRSMRTIEELQGVVHGVMMGGARYSVGASDEEPEGALELRSCSRYITEDEKLVGWMSYRDVASGEFVIPNLALLERYDQYLHRDEIEDSDRYERFFAGEARVLIVGGAEEGSIDIFATPECEPELVEHFLVAIRGAPQASLLHHLWLRELERFLGVSMEGFEIESLGDFMRDDVVTRCVSHTDGFGESSILLQISPQDPEDQIFQEMFGRPTLECAMIMCRREATPWMRPRFEWRR